MDARPGSGARLIGGSACRERYGKLVKAAVSARVEHQQPFPAHFQQWQDHIDAYEARIKLCWKKYEKRNRELAP